ncbi:MAG: aa3-type cytochrome c oxidase subunit IV [Pseudomonadota bacterium]
MADHEHGEMNIEVQEKTFDAFMKWTVRTVIVICVILIWMAIFIS